MIDCDCFLLWIITLYNLKILKIGSRFYLEFFPIACTKFYDLLNFKYFTPIKNHFNNAIREFY